MLAANITTWRTGHKDADRSDGGRPSVRRLRNRVGSAGLRRAQLGSCGCRPRTADGSHRDRRPDPSLHDPAALTPTFIAGMVLDIVGFLGSIVSARLIPLFLSQTIISANLVVTAVLGVLILGVRLRRRDWMAIATVVVSLLVLGLTAGHAGARPAERALHWGVLAASVVILGGGVALIRVLGARAAVPAGLIAGVLFVRWRWRCGCSTVSPRFG